MSPKETTRCNFPGNTWRNKAVTSDDRKSWTIEYINTSMFHVYHSHLAQVLNSLLLNFQTRNFKGLKADLIHSFDKAAWSLAHLCVSLSVCLSSDCMCIFFPVNTGSQSCPLKKKSFSLQKPAPTPICVDFFKLTLKIVKVIGFINVEMLCEKACDFWKCFNCPTKGVPDNFIFDQFQFQVCVHTR